MNILFCNIAWMKYYNGNTDDDKPKNGGSYIKENEDGGECYNFRDYNGKCYGYVMKNGNFALEKHFENCTTNSAFAQDVLVIWVATNEISETRIVGWYKEATVYREEQYIYSFLNPYNWSTYSIVADSKNCFLLPESKRDFPIQRAAITGKGTGMGRSNTWYAESQFAQNVLIPKVIQYIGNYADGFANIVYTEELLNKVIDNCSVDYQYQEFLQKGFKYLDEEDYLMALKYFNTALKAEETTDCLYNIGNSLLNLLCLDRAIDVIQKIFNKEGYKKDSVSSMIACYDLLQDKIQIVKYINIYLDLPDTDTSDEDINLKIDLYSTLFYIHVSNKDKANAQNTLDRFVKENFTDLDESINEMKRIIETEF